MPMPTVNDLQTMYGAWNPQAYLQAQENAGLARQIEEQNYAQEQENTRKLGLDNLFTKQNMPEKLRTTGLENRSKELGNVGLEQTNESKDLQLERDRAMQKFNLAADQRKALLQVTDDELKQADQAVERLRRSLDPEKQKLGQQLYDLTGAARALKQKHADEMTKERFKEGEATKRTGMSNATSIKVAEINQAGQTARKGMGTGATWGARTSKMKVPELVVELRGILSSNRNPDSGEPLTDIERQFFIDKYNQATTILDAKPSPISGSDIGIKPDGKQGLVPKETRPSTNILNKEKEKPKLPAGWVQKN